MGSEITVSDSKGRHFCPSKELVAFIICYRDRPEWGRSEFFNTIHQLLLAGF